MISPFRRIQDELFLGMQQLLSLLPDSGVSLTLRSWFYRPRLKRCGRLRLLSGVKIYTPQHVSIGDDVAMNVGVLVAPCDGGEIEIGDNVIIGPYCVLRASDHEFRKDITTPIMYQGHVGGPIVIESDCWLGSHVVVTRNVRIGRGSVIGAHSVVTHDIPPYSIAMGVPARITGTRLPPPADGAGAIEG